MVAPVSEWQHDDKVFPNICFNYAKGAMGVPPLVGVEFLSMFNK